MSIRPIPRIETLHLNSGPEWLLLTTAAEGEHAVWAHEWWMVDMLTDYQLAEVYHVGVSPRLRLTDRGARLASRYRRG